MNREKLNKAAEEYSGDVFNSYPEDVVSDNTLEYECNKAFRSGAEWLMQQPLSERLTEAEKEKIRDIIKHPQRHTEPIKGTLNFQAIGIKKVLTEIFGADLFGEE